MNINEMNIEQVNARIEEIRGLMDAEDADLDALAAELDQIEERKKVLASEEAKKAEIRKKVAEGEIGEVIKDKVIEEERKMTDKEIRNSAEYGKAFVKYFKTGKDEECRALLSTNVSTGVVPVPEALDNEIRNAWENCQIMSLVKKTYFPGNIKVGFEVSATAAVVHVEGTEAPDEEVLVWGTAELKPESIKKWITISDEAIDATTIDTLGEIYKEIAQRIVEKAEAIAIGKITAAPAVTSATAAGVPVHTAATITESTIVEAVALLSGQARDLHIAMNRQTYAAFVAVGLKAKYNVDVFDGLRDRVVFTDALPAFSAASGVYAVVGDFGYGFQANFPNGNEMKMTVDELSLAEKDLVKVVGRQFVGMNVVAPKAFVKISK